MDFWMPWAFCWPATGLGAGGSLTLVHSLALHMCTQAKQRKTQTADHLVSPNMHPLPVREYLTLTCTRVPPKKSRTNTTDDWIYINHRIIQLATQKEYPKRYPWRNHTLHGENSALWWKDNCHRVTKHCGWSISSYTTRMRINPTHRWTNDNQDWTTTGEFTKPTQETREGCNGGIRTHM